jgi:hypothetical protein
MLPQEPANIQSPTIPKPAGTREGLRCTIPAAAGNHAIVGGVLGADSRLSRFETGST